MHNHILHPHDHEHDHDSPHHHHHHDHPHSHGSIGHNHGASDHLHSHPHGENARERVEELKVLMTAFVNGFRAAEDKTSYLRLAHIPFRRTGRDGLSMHLIDAKIVSNWQIGTASPAFGSRELSYLPYPGAMVSERESMSFTYVSLSERADIDLGVLLQEVKDR